MQMPEINLGFQFFFFFFFTTDQILYLKTLAIPATSSIKYHVTLNLITESVNLPVLKAKSITEASLETNQMFKIQLLDQRN